MSNSITPSGNVQIKVPFHGAELYVVEHNGQPYAPMRPIVEGMGLAWQPQHRKLADSRFESTVTELVTVAQDGKQRKVICMPLRKLPGWLMSIEPGKVKDAAIRARVVKYQSECDDALWQYWNEGIAINPRVAYSVNDSDALTKEEQDVLRRAVESAAKHLPKERRAAAIIKMWSKLKSHFKVSYREIPRIEFTEALSIVQRTAAEWEVVEDQPQHQGIPFVIPNHGRYLVTSSALGAYLYSAEGLSLVRDDDLARVQRDMLTIGNALVDMRRRIKVLTGEEDRVILLKPVAIDLRVA